jgi:hypothetical protein
MLSLNNRYLILRIIKATFHKYSLDYIKKKSFYHFFKYYFFMYTKRNIFFFYFKNILKQIRKLLFEFKKKTNFLKKISNEQTYIVKTENLSYIEFFFFYWFRKLNDPIGFFLFKPYKVIFQLNNTMFSTYSHILNTIEFASWWLNLIEKNKQIKTIEGRIFKKMLNYSILPKRFYFFSKHIYKPPNIPKVTDSEKILIYKNFFFTLFENIKKKILPDNTIKLIFYIKIQYKLSKYIVLELDPKNHILNLFIVIINYLSLGCIFLIKKYQLTSHNISNCIFIKVGGAMNRKKKYTKYLNYIKTKNIQIHKEFIKNILFILSILSI